MGFKMSDLHEMIANRTVETVNCKKNFDIPAFGQSMEAYTVYI